MADGFEDLDRNAGEPVVDFVRVDERGTLLRLVAICTDSPAANRLDWSTPDNLGPGTYTYFCRVHPYMRGAFRVK